MAQSSYAEDYLRSRSAAQPMGYAVPERSKSKAKPKVNRKVDVLPENKAKTLELSRSQLGVAILCIIIASALAIGTVCANAYASSIKYSINQISHENTVITDEIRILKRNVAKANSIEFVEEVATTEFSMVYPKSNQVIYIEQGDERLENLPEIIREKAYKN